MPALALTIRPTQNGWAVCLTNGHELVRYRGLGAKQFALAYLRRYTRSAAVSPGPSRWSRG